MSSSTKQCAIVPLIHAEDVAAATVPVAGEASLVRVVRSVHPAVAQDEVVVATQPALAGAVEECLRSAGLATRVAVTRGPGSRRHVLRAGLEHLDVAPDGPGWVLICDHRYPLSSGEVASRVLAALAAGGEVVVPVVAVTDTVKTVDELGSVLGTVDRAALRTVQYPRGLTAAALWQLVAEVPPTALDGLDEFDAALRVGLEVGVVDGDAGAVRVELPRDAHLLDAVIVNRRD
ncbi:2-C-methyl-D-erythritol 4-phosphate cytidylyltransferase [Mycobacterium yunnanensis]|uniref:2-C-methyl-D-erythritol 4-phosphate cytidylyltransferase n=1 Tax=Mycobacterium yunnanensis TaxID=368477 RepID=A0A9X3C3E4_9MYCO|nr:2-C-methyl-D-erythritol 4-phosphate cytidylyltransferase [Mycobacterium yunnanensis]MCV7424253.1 2-C-methyl-D-erythritol 4-phosphate cytidylyltransferase [Mycobacterium yunnanensis]